jgi:CO/xanthine dehydrogenase FAD-binding subunit
MKAAAFDFVQPSSIDETCRHLARTSDDPQIIAGGQSLMPMMAMRLVRPGLIVDINKIEALSGIAEWDDGVTIGACTRQADAEASPIVRTQLPLLKKALRFVGHDQTRNRGTIGGSLAHADPSAEICLTAIALGANITLTSAKGKRDLTAADFILGPMTLCRSGPGRTVSAPDFKRSVRGRAISRSSPQRPKSRSTPTAPVVAP